MLHQDDIGWREQIEQFVSYSHYFSADEPIAFSAEEESEQFRFLRTFLTVAAEYAVKQGYSPESREAVIILEEAWTSALSIRNAFQLPFSNDDRERLRSALEMSWSVEPNRLIDDIRKFAEMQVDTAALEFGIGRYISSEFKDPRIDRYLAKALADMEISNFLWTQIGPGIPMIKSPWEQAQQGIFWYWLKHRLVGLLISALIIAGLIALANFAPSTPLWLTLGGSALVAAGWLIGTIISTVYMLVRGPKIAAAHKRLLTTIQAAVDFYTEFRSSGTISLSHYRKRLEEARQQGIVWPQTLWALIDDMEFRGVRSF